METITLEQSAYLAEIVGVFQFTFAASRVFRTFHELYYQWHERAMDESVWHAWTAILTDAMQYPGFQEVWVSRRHHYTKDFQDFVDSHIGKAKDAKPLDVPPEP